jgi:hypothetical protein
MTFVRHEVIICPQFLYQNYSVLTCSRIIHTGCPRVAKNLHNLFVIKDINFYFFLPGDQEGLFKLAVQLRKIFNSVIYNTATGYVLLVYLTNI